MKVYTTPYYRPQLALALGGFTADPAEADFLVLPGPSGFVAIELTGPSDATVLHSSARSVADAAAAIVERAQEW